MQYMFLLYDEEPTTAPDPAAIEQLINEYVAYEGALKAAGVTFTGEALQDSTTATTVRMKDTERITTDGPFAETREVLGGYYLVDVPDLDTALDWAARCPAAKTGSVEVRPIQKFE